MTKTTSDSILGVIRKESWQIRDINMVMPPGEQHGVGGGLRSLTAFLVVIVYQPLRPPACRW